MRNPLMIDAPLVLVTQSPPKLLTHTPEQRARDVLLGVEVVTCPVGARNLPPRFSPLLRRLASALLSASPADRPRADDVETECIQRWGSLPAPDTTTRHHLADRFCQCSEAGALFWVELGLSGKSPNRSAYAPILPDGI